MGAVLRPEIVGREVFSVNWRKALAYREGFRRPTRRLGAVDSREGQQSFHAPPGFGLNSVHRVATNENEFLSAEEKRPRPLPGRTFAEKEKLEAREHEDAGTAVEPSEKLKLTHYRRSSSQGAGPDHSPSQEGRDRRAPLDATGVAASALSSQSEFQ